jgi:hypothetical protein
MMIGDATDKAMLGSKTKVSIRTSEMRDCIKSNAIHGSENRNRELRFGKELYIVGVVELGHS